MSHGIALSLLLALCLAVAVAKRDCQSATCQSTAREMKANMNPRVNPCDNFYEYACGNWINNNPPPSSSGVYASFYKINNEVKAKIRSLISSPRSSKDAVAVRKLRGIYKSCINVAQIEQRGDAPLQKLLGRLGGFPMLDGVFRKTHFNLNLAIAKYMNNGFMPFFLDSIRKGSPNDPPKKMYLVGQPRLHMPSKKFKMGITYYKNFITTVAGLMNAKSRTLSQDIDDLVKFASDLNDIMVPETYNGNYRKRTFKELSRLSRLNFEKIINFQTKKAGSSYRIRPSTLMYDFATQYWAGLNRLLSKTKLETIVNYMAWDVVYNTIGYLSERKYGNAIKTFAKKALGHNPRGGSRKNICVDSISYDSSFTPIISRMYVDKYFDKRAKDTASEMIENIRKSFEDMLSNVQWMDAKARKAGFRKAAAIKKNVGYPEELMDNAKLNSKYSKMTGWSSAYFANTVSIWRNTRMEDFKQLGKMLVKFEWHITATTVNAFYEPSLNRISIPAAILQKPFYDKDHPKYLNFAGIGYVIGHELTHGFDNSGKDYDLNGNHVAWWSPATLAKYKVKAKCFVDMYNGFRVPEVNSHVNGKLTLNENLADNGGILESFRAYRTYIKNLGHEEPTLPGLNLSPNQLFYLNSAQVWCGKVLTTNSWWGVLNEVHAPMRYRVWGSLMNSPEFHKAYNCKLGDKMRPTNQCHMW